MSSYLQHINREIFINKTTELTVIQSSHYNEAEYYLNELLNDYSKTLNDIKIKVNVIRSSKPYIHSFAYFNVMFIDSYESFRKINPGPITRKHDFSEYYVIVYYTLSQEPEKEIQKIFDYCWQYYTVNVALLLKTEHVKDILLYTYYPFTSKYCKNPQIRVINRNKSIMALKATEIFPKKFKNLYNCSLTAAVWNVPPYLMLPPTKSSLGTKILGIEGYLLKVLAKVFKFQVEYVVPPNNEQRGYVKPNGALTGAIRMLDERLADLSLGSFRCTLERSTALSPTRTFYQTMQVFTVLSFQQSLSSLEIITYPFQLHIWIVFMIIIIFLLTSALILRSYLPNILRFIYGNDSVYLIVTNMTAITLNQTATFLPQRNFARYLCLMWILLTMILRSIYQGALYEFLRAKKNCTPPNTADDLITRNYKLIVNMATNNTFSGVPAIRDKLLEVIIMDIADSAGFPLLEANPDKNYVTGTPKDFLSYYVKCHGKHGVFHVLKETIFAQHLCVYFTKHSYLVESFDHVLSNLRYFGLIDYWARKMLNTRNVENVNNTKPKAPFTLRQLSGIMEICLCLYFITFIVFLLEVFWYKLQVKRNLDTMMLRVKA